jgi:predicted nucleotide-binding protein (sugar kinase/HSP70/actin superfamily)
MKYSFPYLGNVLVYKKLLEMLGYEVVVPPRPTQKTIDLGTKNSPEFACFPYKMLMGNYIEACEQGAGIIVTSGGHGPCRAGFYGELHERTLRHMGYDVELIIFDSIKRDLRGDVSKFFRLKGKNSLRKVISTGRVILRMLKDLDEFDKKIHTMIPYETVHGSCLKAFEEIRSSYDRCWTMKETETAYEEAKELLASIKLEEVDERDKIRIGVVGEIFVVIESSINMDIENTLCSLGCEAERSQYIGEWVDHNFFGKGREKEILKMGEDYIKIIIGGHAKQNVGHIVDYSKRGFDGVIHLMPFACLPELVSQSIIPRISEDYGIPVLTLAIDEQSGKANSMTRIEAFVDLIKNSKRKKMAAKTA